jgi:hypothetical protein
MFKEKTVEKIKILISCLIHFFPKIVPFMRQCGTETQLILLWKKSTAINLLAVSITYISLTLITFQDHKHLPPH